MSSTLCRYDHIFISWPLSLDFHDDKLRYIFRILFWLTRFVQLTPSADKLLDRVERVCQISAELSEGWEELLKPHHGALGPYYTFEFQIGISFAGAELRAYIQWDDKVRPYLPLPIHAQSHQNLWISRVSNVLARRLSFPTPSSEVSSLHVIVFSVTFRLQLASISCRYQHPFPHFRLPS